MKNYENYRMYILVREQFPASVAVNSSAHGSMNAYMKWNGEIDFDGWREHSFRKVTCMVSDKELEHLYSVMRKNNTDFIEQTENRLDKAHILTVCFPFDSTLHEFKAFKFLRLYKSPDEKRT